MIDTILALAALVYFRQQGRMGGGGDPDEPAAKRLKLPVWDANFERDIQGLNEYLELQGGEQQQLQVKMFRHISTAPVSTSQSSVENLTEAFERDGFMTFQSDPDVLQSIQRTFIDGAAWQNVATGAKNAQTNNRVMTRLSEKSDASALLDRLIGVLTDMQVTDIIKAYLSPDTEGSAVKCFSHLSIDALQGSTSQKLHTDHQDVHQKEVVVAIDLGGQALGTRYLLGTHRMMTEEDKIDVQKSINAIPRDVRMTLKGSQTHEQMCTSIRLQKAIKAGQTIPYAQNTDSAIQMFDASGIHAGTTLTALANSENSSCDHLAFRKGDEVLVEPQSATKAVVTFEGRRYYVEGSNLGRVKYAAKVNEIKNNVCSLSPHGGTASKSPTFFNRPRWNRIFLTFRRQQWHNNALRYGTYAGDNDTWFVTKKHPPIEI